MLWAPAPAAGPPAGRRERIATFARHQLLPLALYGLLALVATFPLVLHFGAVIPSDTYNGDAVQNYWNYWWVREAVTRGQNPFWMPLIYAPYGAPLYLHALSFLNGLISLPLHALFGPVPAYNLLILLTFMLVGYCAYALCAAVSGSRLAGFAGGAIYAFSAYHLARQLNHMNLFSSEAIPLYVLCLIAATGARGRRRTLLTLAAVAALLALMFADWQYVMFMAFFTALFAAYHAIARRSVAPLLIAAAIGALWAALAAPYLAATIAEMRSGIVAPPPETAAEGGSADLLSFVVPGPRQAQWGGWAAALDDRFRTVRPELTSFLGYLPLALGLLGCWLDRRRARFWALAAAVFALLALGPTLQIAGRASFGAGGWSVPLPYRLVQQVPGLNFARIPARFSLLVTLSLAVLAALALAQLARRVPRLAAPRVRLLALALLVLACLGEQLALPIPLQAIDQPPFYRELGQSGEPGTIFEWPFCKQCARTNGDQVAHQRPIIGGYISRRLGYPIRDLPPHRLPPEIPPDIIPSDVPADLGRWSLRYSDVRWVVIRKDDPDLNTVELPEFLQDYTAPGPLYEDAQMAVYRPRPPGDPLTFLELGDGWLDRERMPDGRTRMRWVPREAGLIAWAFGAPGEAYTLRFDAWSFHQPRRLEVRIDGRAIGQWRVGDLQHLDIPVRLADGRHAIALVSLDPPQSPASVGAGDDPRPLAIAVARLDLVPQGATR